MSESKAVPSHTPASTEPQPTTLRPGMLAEIGRTIRDSIPEIPNVFKIEPMGSFREPRG